jgi:hypothetical protein
MNSKYTPGPWHVTGSDPAGAMVVNKAGDVVAGWPEIARFRNMANARLIAAAPAMLDELYRLLPFIEDAERDPAYKPGVVRERTKAIRAILSRIGEV